MTTKLTDEEKTERAWRRVMNRRLDQLEARIAALEDQHDTAHKAGEFVVAVVTHFARRVREDAENRDALPEPDPNAPIN